MAKKKLSQESAVKEAQKEEPPLEGNNVKHVPQTEITSNTSDSTDTTSLTAEDRTKSLTRTFLHVDDLEPNDQNPNEMGEAEFNLLYDNVDRMGVTDPILCRPKVASEISKKSPAKFKIVGGHHRWEIAKLHGISEVPVTIITDPSFDADQEKFQMVRHNVIHGKMSPKKFMSLYQSLQGKYAEDVAAELFGFANEDEFKKLVQSTAQALPPEMKQSFLDASKEIRTIDDLAVVLNRLFTTYGDTVPYGYMIFDFGGQDHVWLRMKKGQKKQVFEFGDLCRQHNRTVDSGMSALMTMMTSGNEDVRAVFEELLLKFPEVSLEGVSKEELPSEDFMAALVHSDEM